MTPLDQLSLVFRLQQRLNGPGRQLGKRLVRWGKHGEGTCSLQCVHQTCRLHGRHQGLERPVRYGCVDNIIRSPQGRRPSSVPAAMSPTPSEGGEVRAFPMNDQRHRAAARKLWFLITRYRRLRVTALLRSAFPHSNSPASHVAEGCPAGSGSGSGLHPITLSPGKRGGSWAASRTAYSVRIGYTWKVASRGTIFARLPVLASPRSLEPSLFCGGLASKRW
jgi:hypothetical protein